MTLRFSANLGFLWTELPLPEAIRAAARAGFDAVECHWPYAVPTAQTTAALEETGLPMLGLNTVRGDVEGGENGLCALPGREAEARAAIDQAFDYGAAIGARAVHVMAGKAEGPAAREAFLDNLAHACDRAAAAGMTALIEPLNPRDAPGYFLRTQEQAAELIEALGRPELKIMFDCYHVQATQGDVLRRFEAVRAHVGHVQFAGAPARGRPDEGEVAFDRLLPAIAAAGWDRPFGAEYKPGGPTEATLGWLEAMKR
ncbi:MAG: TIM barrel protein [Pseudomonadota bacterium]